MKKIDPATLAVWGGEEDSLVQGATQVPVVYSAAYGYPDVDTWLDVAPGRKPGHIYSRNTNPTVHAFEEKMRLLEGAEAATSFATGMAAISNTLFTLLSPGDRIVSVKDTYGGTNKIFTEFLPRFQYPGHAVRHDRSRADRGGDRRGLPGRLPRNAHQPDAQSDGHRAAGRGRPQGGRDRRGRQHVCDAHQSESARARRGPGAAQRDQIPRRPRGCAGRRRVRLARLVEQIYHYREITGATLDPMAAYLLIRGLKTLRPPHPPAKRERAQDRALAASISPRSRPSSIRGWSRTTITTSPDARCAASAAS